MKPLRGFVIAIALCLASCSVARIETTPEGACRGYAGGLFMDISEESMTACGASRNTGAAHSNTEIGSQLIQAGRELIQAGK